MGLQTWVFSLVSIGLYSREDQYKCTRVWDDPSIHMTFPLMRISSSSELALENMSGLHVQQYTCFIYSYRGLLFLFFFWV